LKFSFITVAQEPLRLNTLHSKVWWAISIPGTSIWLIYFLWNTQKMTAITAC